MSGLTHDSHLLPVAHCERHVSPWCDTPATARRRPQVADNSFIQSLSSFLKGLCANKRTNERLKLHREFSNKAHKNPESGLKCELVSLYMSSQAQTHLIYHSSTCWSASPVSTISYWLPQQLSSAWLPPPLDSACTCCCCGAFGCGFP